MKKTIRKIFSALVAVCLCTSMVPAQAVALTDDEKFVNGLTPGSVSTNNGEAAVDGVEGFYHIPGASTRQGENTTKVFGVLQDQNFRFLKQSSDMNFKTLQESVDNTKDNTTPGPLFATFGGSESTYEYRWYIAKVTIEDNGSYTYSPHNTSGFTFSGPGVTNQPFSTVNGDGTLDRAGTWASATFGVPAENPSADPTTFTHSIAQTEADSFTLGDIYRYTLSIKDTNNANEYIDANIFVSFMANFENKKIFLGENPPELATSAEGFLYISGTVVNPVVPILDAQDISPTSPVYAELANAAASSSPVQNIAQPTQLVLTNLQDKPDTEPPYKMGLRVHMGIPADYPGTLKVDDTVPVYRYDQATGTVEALEGKVVVQTKNNEDQVDNDGQPLLSIEVVLHGTGAALGSFAVGYANPAGSFTVESSTTAGGTISPEEKQTYAVGSSPQFVMNAQTGYVLKSVSLTCDGSMVNMNLSTLVGNVFTLDASIYQMADGEAWTVKAMFEEPTLTAEEFSVSAHLRYDGDPSQKCEGTMDVLSGAPGSIPYTVAMDGDLPPVGDPAIMMPAREGVYLEFNPGEGFRVKSLVIGRDTFVVEGTSYFISVLTENTDIVVTYEEGIPEPTVTRTIDVTVGANGAVSGSDGSPQSSTQITVNYGSTATVSLIPDDGYMVDTATLRTAGAPASDPGINVADQITQTKTDTGMRANLQIHNVLQNMTLDVTFKEEDGNVVISVEADAGQAPGGTVTPSGTVSLDADKAQQIRITPSTDGDGYTVGSVLLNGAPLNLADILTARNGGAFYTFKIVKSTLPPSSFERNPDGTVDKVLSITEKNSTIRVRFDKVTPPAPSYVSVVTRVDGGGGSITPTQRVTPGSKAEVWVFPDENMRVKDITLDGRSVKDTNMMTEDGALLTIPEVQTDLEVVVTFEEGTSALTGKKTYTLHPSAGTGGSVSPASETKIYAGQGQSFNIVPSTGYQLSEIIRDGVTVWGENIEALSADESYEDNVYTIGNVQADHNLIFTFKKFDSGPLKPSTFEVEVTAGEHGTASPLGVTEVATGSSLPISIIPNPNYCVDAIMVHPKGSTSSGANFVSALVNGVYTQYDVQDDLVIEITFRQGTDPNQPSTDINNLVRLGARNLDIDPGIILTPELAGMTFYKEEGTDHASVTQTVTVQVAAGYALGNVTVNGKALAATEVSDGVYTVMIPKEEITSRMLFKVTATQVPPSTQVVDLRTITITKDGNGTVSPGGIDGFLRVETGESQTFYFIPNNGWKVESVQVDGSMVNWDKERFCYTVDAVTQDMRIHVTFSEDPTAGRPVTKQVTFKADIASDDKTHGLISVGTAEVTIPGELTVTFKPDSGYETHVFDTTWGTPQDVTDQLRNGTLYLTNIQEDRTYTVKFEPLTQPVTYQTVTSSSGGNGHVSPEGTLTVATGSKMTFTFVGDAGYTVDKVWVNYKDANGKDVSEEVGDQVRNDYATTHTLAYTMDITSKTDVWASFKERTSPSDPPDGPGLNLAKVTAVAGIGGSISPQTVEVAVGAEVPFTIMPLRGYQLNSLSDGVQDLTSQVKDGVFTLLVQRPVTLTAKFEASETSNPEGNKHDVYLEVADSGDGSTHGSISPEGVVSVPHGGSVPFTIIPDDGYMVDTITIKRNGSADQVISNFKGFKYTCMNVEAKTTVTVKFKLGDAGARPTFFDVTASASVNGSISPAGTVKVAEGGMAMFSFQPNEGFRLSYLVIDGQDVPSSSVMRGQYSFTGVNANHTIHAVFCGVDEEAVDFVTINAGIPSGGSITPSGAQVVMKGTSPQYTISAFYGYTLTDIQVNGQSIFADGPAGDKNIIPVNNTNVSWSNSTLTLKDVQADAGIVALFKQTSVAELPETKYSRVTVNANGPGTVSFNNGTTVIEALPEGKTLDVSIVPDEGKALGELSVKAANGDNIDLTNTSDATVAAELRSIWQKGYITLTADQVNYAVTISVSFREPNEDEQKLLDNGTLKPAATRTITAQAFGRGTITPHGEVKVAQTASLTFSMVPMQGYELSALHVDGKDAMGMLTGSRTYTFTPGVKDQKIEATFSQMSSADQGITYKVSTAIDSKDGASGNASVDSMEVAAGGSATLYFWPDASSKLTALTVVTYDQQGKEVESLNFAYDMPSYTLSNISGDTTVIAYFEPGESPWTVTEAYVEASVLDGGGRVAPAKATVPKGCQQTFSIIPDSGNEVSFLRVNGEIIYVDGNIRNYTMIADSDDPSNPDTLEVMFKNVTAVSDDVTVKATVEAKTQFSTTGGTADLWPAERSVAYGSSAVFYVRPELGYTIRYVEVDGDDSIKFEGVESDEKEHYGPNGADWDAMKARMRSQVNASEEQAAEQGGTYHGGAFTLPALYTGGAQVFTTGKDDIPAERKAFYEVYKITLPNITHDVTANIGLIKIDDVNLNGNYYFVSSNVNTLEVTSDGGGTVSPVGKGFLPVGQSENIRLNTFTGYYLESVMCTYGDGTKVDMTHRVVGNNLQVIMGEQSMSIHAKFTPVGEASFVHFTLGRCEDPFGQDISPHVTTSPLLVNPDGTPADFVRDVDGTGLGTLIGFLPDSTVPQGDRLVLDKVWVNGVQIPLTYPDSCYVRIPTTAGGEITVQFRELEPGHEAVVPEFFTITGEVTAGKGEITEGPLLVTAGGNEKVGFKPAEDWILDTENCFDWYAETDPETGELASEMTAHAINPADLADGYYLVKGVDRNHKITVAFKQSVTLSIRWTNGDNGYITPNTMNGDPLEVAAGQSYDYIVAPYEGYDVANVTETMGGAESDVTGRLRMSEATTQALLSQVGDGFTVKHTQEGLGVSGPVAEPQTRSRQAVVQAAAIENGAIYADAPVLNASHAPALENFNFAYGSQTSPLTGNAEINAQWTNENNVVKPELRTVTVEIIGNVGGTVDPMVGTGYDGEYITFQFFPEDGWAVRYIEVTKGGQTERLQSGSSGGKEEYTYGPIEGDGAIKVGFDSIAHPGANDTLSRYLRTLQALAQTGTSLAQTGDLIFPVIATLLGVAVLALAMAFVTRRRSRKRAGRHA